VVTSDVMTVNPDSLLEARPDDRTEWDSLAIGIQTTRITWENEFDQTGLNYSIRVDEDTGEVIDEVKPLVEMVRLLRKYHNTEAEPYDIEQDVLGLRTREYPADRWQAVQWVIQSKGLDMIERTNLNRFLARYPEIRQAARRVYREGRSITKRD
jgi:hypothetical protein